MMIRLPDGLRASIKSAADQNGRSMTAEMVLRIEQNPSPPSSLERHTDRHSDKFMLRLPKEVHADIVRSARAHRRSMNSEAVLRLISPERSHSLTEAPSSHLQQQDRHETRAYPLRLPADVRSRVQAAADRNGRSLNAEIINRLSGSYGLGGISLRNYFAAEAMKGLLTRQWKEDERGRQFVEWVTEFSFQMADAMVKASEGGAA